jgi:multidrug resistance efflux pump
MPVTAARSTRQASVAAMAPEHANVVAPGVVEPWGAQVDLAAQESGWIARIAVREGDVVRAGQLLATLDDAAQGDAVALARADLAEAEAALLKTERGATPEELRQAQAEYDAASAQATFARAAAARAGRLHEDGTIPDNEAERSATDARVQTAQAERAEAHLQELQRGARAEDRSAARARADAARARLWLAEASLARRRVVAPSSGTVLLSRFHPGEFYSAGAGPVFVLGDMTRLQVRLEVDEIDAHDVRDGAPCTLTSDGGLPLAEGTIIRLAPRMGRRGLPLESPTARADVRVREVFVAVAAATPLVPGQRVWGHTPRLTTRVRT